MRKKLAGCSRDASTLQLFQACPEISLSSYSRKFHKNCIKLVLRNKFLTTFALVSATNFLCNLQRFAIFNEV